MLIPKLKAAEVSREPYLVWNAFVRFIACGPIEQFTAVQRAAHLCFWYDAEVQNGGHLQYFENRGTMYLVETLQSLELLNAFEQRKILQTAGELWQSQTREPIASLQEYSDRAMTGEFSEFDSAFYKCRTTIESYLRKYLANHQSDFVCIE